MIERAMRTSNPARLPNSFNSRRTRQREGGEPYHRITNFLPEQEAQYIVDRILSQQSKFCLMIGNRNFLRLPGPIEPSRPSTKDSWQFCRKFKTFSVSISNDRRSSYMCTLTMMGRTSAGTRMLTAAEIGAGAFPVFSTPFANHADSREVIWSCMTGGDALLPLNPNTTRQCSSRVICFMKCYL